MVYSLINLSLLSSALPHATLFTWIWPTWTKIQDRQKIKEKQDNNY